MGGRGGDKAENGESGGRVARGRGRGEREKCGGDRVEGGGEVRGGGCGPIIPFIILPTPNLTQLHTHTQCRPPNPMDPCLPPCPHLSPHTNINTHTLYCLFFSFSMMSYSSGSTAARGALSSLGHCGGAMRGAVRGGGDGGAGEGSTCVVRRVRIVAGGGRT